VAPPDLETPFQRACRELDAEVLDPVSPLWAGRLKHPRWPDATEDRELWGGPPVMKPLHDFMFDYVGWSESWPARLAEVRPRSKIT
jgi:hypothetical protein